MRQRHLWFLWSCLLSCLCVIIVVAVDPKVEGRDCHSARILSNKLAPHGLLLVNGQVYRLDLDSPPTGRHVTVKLTTRLISQVKSFRLVDDVGECSE